MYSSENNAVFAGRARYVLIFRAFEQLRWGDVMFWDN